MEPTFGRNQYAPLTPVKALFFLALLPNKRISLSLKSHHMSPWAMPVRLGIDPYGELRNMGNHDIPRQIKMGAAKFLSSSLPLNEFMGVDIGDMVDPPNPPAQGFRLLRKIPRFPAVPITESIIASKDKILTVKDTENHRRIGHREKTRRLLRIQIFMLISGIERRGKKRPSGPLKCLAFSLIVPHLCLPSSADHKDHLL